jgi:hypothetical protein
MKLFASLGIVSGMQVERYIDEAVYRFNTKEMMGGDRFAYMFGKAVGRVQYKDVKMAA